MMLGGYISELWGWRTAFVVAGLPGIFFSVIFFRTIREPQNIDQPVSWMATLREMLALRSYRWIIAGQATALFASMGRNLWEPTFLRRVYEMGAGEAGTWYFFTSPLPSAIGIYFGGRFADKLWKRDIRWSMWVPTIGQLACVPLLTLFLLWPEDHRLPFSSITGGFPVALLWSIPASLVGSFYAAPMLSMTQGLAPPSNARARSGPRRCDQRNRRKRNGPSPRRRSQRSPRADIRRVCDSLLTAHRRPDDGRLRSLLVRCIAVDSKGLRGSWRAN